MSGRNPARMDPIIEKLRVSWKANPHMRLGQLVCNRTARPYGLEHRHPFYVEDNVLQWDQVPVMYPEWEGPYWLEEEEDE
jgi:hypothetical protein